MSGTERWLGQTLLDLFGTWKKRTVVITDVMHSGQARSNEKGLAPAERVKNAFEGMEAALVSLVEGVGKFNVKDDMGVKIVASERELSEAICEILEHQRICDELAVLQKETENLDNDIHHILVGLSDARRKLLAIPTKKKSNKSNKVGAQDLLDYSTKITKFTHAPPGYDSEQPDNANLPWPSEDELRRGSMALLAAEGESESEGKGGVMNNTGDSGETAKNFARQRRRSSLVTYGEKPVVEAPSSSSKGGILDLDLFEPDDEEE